MAPNKKPFGKCRTVKLNKKLRRTVWSVGTNLRKQVGADWTLPSCPMGYHIHVTWSISRL
jgi:hypothetical protein